MPDLPPFLAERSERWFGRPCTVLSVDPITPKLRFVRFGGAALRHLHWSAGQEVEFRVDARSFRHYTPSAYDPDTGEMEILFYLHGQGPGSAWAAHLTPGQPAALMGPGGGVPFRATGDWHVLLGDETALGLFKAFQAASPPGHPLFGAAEVAEEDAPALRRLALPLSVIHRQEGRPGDALIAWLKHTAFPMGRGVVYLVGHAQTIQSLRAVLLQHHQMSREQIKTKPYWATGKRGL